MPKIRQNSPIKVKSSKKENVTQHDETSLDVLSDAAEALAHKEDGVDLQLRDDERKAAMNVQSDPTSAYNCQRKRRSVIKRNYRQMLEGDEVIQKTI